MLNKKIRMLNIIFAISHINKLYSDFMKKNIRCVLLILGLLVFNADAFAQKSDVFDYHNVAFGNSDKQRKANINIGLSGDVDTLKGLQSNILSSTIRKNGSGVNFAIASAITANDFKGVHFSSMYNGVAGTIKGVQFSTITNMAKHTHGLQLAGFNNINGTDLRGVQVSGIGNISMGVRSGVQFSGIMNVCADKMNGFQFASFNYCDTLNGWQLGLINICISHPKGVQVGLINYTRDDTKRKIGLVNVSPQTKMQMLAYWGNSSAFNLAARFLNKMSYSMLGMGTHYMGLSKDFSGSLFYRTGYWFSPIEKTILSCDLGFYHIETFNNADEITPERLYSLQVRGNYEYEIIPKVKFFVSLGYGTTFYYDHNALYRRRFLLDMGIVLF